MKETLKKATHRGTLDINGIKIPCFVLEGGIRVISGRGMTTAIGMKGRGQGVTRIPDHGTLKPYINNDLDLAIREPLKFIGGVGSRKANPTAGYEATRLLEISEAILTARDDGALKTAQELRYAKYCEKVVRGLAHVGIIALVDEVTGYQDERVKGALEKILSKYLLQEKKPYIGMFPLWFYREIYRLNNWHWSPENAQKRPGVIGKWTNELIYGKMAPGLLKEIQKRNPTVKPGRRAFKNFQLLTDEIGDPALRAHFDGLGALMRASTQWRKFRALVEKAYPDPNKTLELELGYHESPDKE